MCVFSSIAMSYLFRLNILLMLSVVLTGCHHFSNRLSASQQQVNRPHVVSPVPYQSVIEQAYKGADQHISYGSHSSQFGLLWQPVPEQGSKPLVVFIHGGCWLSEYNIEHSYALASAIASQGYPVWSIEYRRTGETGGGWPTTFRDIVAGIAASAQLESNNIDTSKIVLAGHSAGGHLALLAGANWQNEPRLTGLSSSLVGTIGLAAITDIVSYAKGSNSCETATPGFMGGTGEQLPQAYQQANPASFKNWENTWLLHGSADTIVAPEQARLQGAETLMLEGAGHFDWIHPQTKGFEVLINTLSQF